MAMLRAGIFFWLFVVTFAVSIALGLYGHTLGSIQHSRLVNCRQQNQRHDRTIATLNERIAAIEQQTPPARRAAVAAQLSSSKAFTVSLIDDLQPHLNCHARVGN